MPGAFSLSYFREDFHPSVESVSRHEQSIHVYMAMLKMDHGRKRGLKRFSR